MNPENGHSGILLTENAAGRVEYCPRCNAVELEVGAFRLRLLAQDMMLFSALIKEAELRLPDAGLTQAKQNAKNMRVGGVH